MLNYKKFQGFSLKGMNFDCDYAKDIYGCFEFYFKNHMISVSTGAVQPSKGNYPVSLSEILIINVESKEEHYLTGSVEDAIDFVLNNC